MYISFLLSAHIIYVLSNISCPYSFFFFNDTATTEIYTLSLHDALPILFSLHPQPSCNLVDDLAVNVVEAAFLSCDVSNLGDRKSTRLNSSHSQISYAVFCLKKKNNTIEKAHQYPYPIHSVFSQSV